MAKKWVPVGILLCTFFSGIFHVQALAESPKHDPENCVYHDGRLVAFSSHFVLLPSGGGAKIGVIVRSVFLAGKQIQKIVAQLTIPICFYELDLCKNSSQYSSLPGGDPSDPEVDFGVIFKNPLKRASNIPKPKGSPAALFEYVQETLEVRFRKNFEYRRKRREYDGVSEFLGPPKYESRMGHNHFCDSQTCQYRKKPLQRKKRGPFSKFLRINSRFILPPF